MPYLDHAGAALPSEIQMNEIAKFHSQCFLANPHSHHTTALKTRQMVDSARLRVLRHLNASAEEYFVVFTSNTTHSLKTVAENFEFHRGDHEVSNEISNKLLENKSQFGYLNDSHHSVVGLRHIVRNKVDSVCCINEDEILSKLIPETQKSLFVLTAMSNFCGKKYPLDIISKLQEKGWSVCLDAASLMSSSTIDLSVHKPDFLAFSFYKIFGYPTGVGALIIKKSSVNQIRKSSFAGGTVQSVDDSSFFFVSREFEGAYEEGTMNYYAIAQLQKGFEEIERHGSISSIRDKTHKLAETAWSMLQQKKHENGVPVVEVYSQSEHFLDSTQQGPIVAFNLKRPDRGYYGYTEVEKLCAIFGLEVRTGCFCNIGACKKYLNISSDSIKLNKMKGKQCGDEIDIINGKPTGAVRISFGRQSTIEDINALEQMIDTCFIASASSAHLSADYLSIDSYKPQIVKLFSFPIKSCNSNGSTRCQLTSRGIKYDREYMIVQNDLILNLKTHPELSRLNASISDDTLYIETVEKNGNFIVPINIPLQHGGEKMICRNRVSTTDCGDKVGKWLDEALDLSNCRLLRVTQESKRNFVNDSPFLMINEASVYILSQNTNLPVNEIIRRFRSNIVVKGLPPFIEDTAKNITINDMDFVVTNKCTRCEMICVDPETGEKDASLLLALRNFRSKQKITFGIYIRQTNFRNGDTLELNNTVAFKS